MFGNHVSDGGLVCKSYRWNNKTCYRKTVYCTLSVVMLLYCKPGNNSPPLILPVGMKTQNLMDAKADIATPFSCVRYNRMIDLAESKRCKIGSRLKKAKFSGCEIFRVYCILSFGCVKCNIHTRAAKYFFLMNILPRSRLFNFAIKS